MDHFLFLYFYLKKGFACDVKETVIQFDLWQVVAIVALETANDYIKVSLLHEAHVLGFLWFFLSKRPCNFLLFLIQLSLSLWWCVVDEWTSAFNLVATSLRDCFIDLTFSEFLRRSVKHSVFFRRSFLFNWVLLCTLQIFIINHHHILLVCFSCIFLLSPLPLSSNSSSDSPLFWTYEVSWA